MPIKIKLRAIKVIIAAVCFMPFVALANGIPPEPPSVVEVMSILYNENDTIKMLTIILGIPITVGVILEGVRRWKKRH